MTAKIRTDLKQVEGLIGRLLAIGREFQTKDKTWSHLKNKEDWERNVVPIADGKKRSSIERVYCDGRDMSHFMAEALLSINSDIATYPTLTSVVKHFDKTWVTSDLAFVIEDAVRNHDELGLSCWAFQQMVSTFEEQLKLNFTVAQTLNLLKGSDLYKLENGIPVSKENSNITISHVSDSNISVGSSNVNQNIVGTDAIFAELLDAISSSEIEHKETLEAAVKAMQKSHGSSGFLGAYKDFMASAANHMTVVAPFLPALTALL